MNRKHYPPNLRRSIALLLLALIALIQPSPPASAADYPLAAAGQLSSNEEIFGWIGEICALGNRRPGTPEGKKTAEYVLEHFKSFGLDARLDSVPTPVWTATRWGLNVNGVEFPCFYINHSSWTKEFEGFTSGPVDAELVYVGEGRESDFKGVDVRGKIVLVDVRFGVLRQSDTTSVAYFSHDPRGTAPADWQQPNPYSPDNFPGNLERAIKHGAVGFVGILADYYDRNTFYNELYVEAPCHWTIPGLWLSRSDGAALKATLKKNAPNRAVLVLEGTVTPGTAYNVVGMLPGKTDDIIMVHSHHDAPWQSAVEDASGVAEVMALAKYFGAVPKEQREKTLMFVTFDTHFSMYQGHLDMIRRVREQKLNVLVDIVIEHIGKEVVEKDGELVETGYVEPRGIFVTENPFLLALVRQAVERHNLERTVILPTYTILGVPTDAGDFNRRGFNIISLISPPLYIYDPADTPDKVAFDQLNPTAQAFADIILSIDRAPAKRTSSRAWIPRYRFQYYSVVVKTIAEMIID